MCAVTRGAALGAAALMLNGCISPYPRAYVPVMQPPPADAAAFQRDFSGCASGVAANERFFRHGWRLSVIGGGTGAGGMGAAAVIIPHRDGERREKSERAVKSAMEACLAERSYSISGWKLAKGAEAAPSQLLTPTRPTTAPTRSSRPEPSTDPAASR